MDVPEGVRTALLERYRGLNRALQEQLDDITSASVHLDRLHQALREWHTVARDPSLPPGVHYLLDPDPDPDPETLTDALTGGTRNALVVDSLREIARGEDLEVLITVLEFAQPGDDARLVHMADRHGNEIHEYFASDKQELLRDDTASPRSEDRVDTTLPLTQIRVNGVAILPMSKVLDKRNTNPGQTEGDRLRLRENMMCYLADRDLDKTNAVSTNSVVAFYGYRPAKPDQGDPTPLQWPRRALEKHLLNATTVATRAAAISYEPPPQFFEYFADKMVCFPPRRSDVNIITLGLDLLLSRVDFVDLLPVLSHLPPLIHGDQHLSDPAYVGRWLTHDFVDSRCGPGVYLRREYAALIVDICTSFRGAVNLKDIMCGIMRYHHENSAFCFALIARLIEASYGDTTTTDYVACWKYFGKKVLQVSNTRRMARHRSPSVGLLPRFPKASSWENRPLPSQPMDPAIPTTVSKIQYLLDQGPVGLWGTASWMFLEWIKEQLHEEIQEGNDGEALAVFWLPLARDLSQRYDDRFWAPGPEAEPRREMRRDFIRAVLFVYLRVCVGAEPRRRDFCRPGLTAQECDGCDSCRVISRFLLDRSRVRAILPVARAGGPSPRRASQSSSSSSSASASPGYVLRHDALAHVLPLLAARKRNCTFHVRDRTCGGTVLCVEKRDGARHWEDWRRRRGEAAGEMARFDLARMGLILGEKGCRDLVGMDITKRGSLGEWYRMVGKSLCNTETERVVWAERRRGRRDRPFERLSGDGSGDDMEDDMTYQYP